MRSILKLSSLAFLVVAPGIQFIPPPIVLEGHDAVEGSSETTLEANLAASLQVSGRDALKMSRSGSRRTPRAAHGRDRTAQRKPAMNPEVGAIIQRACKDCHSNETTWPWYSHVAPVSWAIANDVKQGREKLNFSVWSSQKPSPNEIEEICDAATSGSMPLRGYRLLHPEATLRQHDVDVLCDWADTVKAQKQKVADASGRTHR